MGMTITEKTLAKKIGKPLVCPGAFIRVPADAVMLHDIASGIAHATI